MDADVQELTDRVERDHWWFVARRRIIASLAERLLPEGGNVVDVGCGRGYVLAALPASWNRTGVDPSEKAIELARRRHPGLDLRVGVAPDDVEDELREADLVLCCDVLEHVEGDRALLGSITGRLRAGAHVLVTVPAWMDMWSRHDERHGHFRRYGEDGLRALWADLPLEPRLVSPLNWRLYPAVRLVRTLARRRGRTAGDGETDISPLPSPLNALLRRVFEGERTTLLAALDDPGGRPPGPGVSWLAVLARTA